MRIFLIVFESYIGEFLLTSMVIECVCSGSRRILIFIWSSSGLKCFSLLDATYDLILHFSFISLAATRTSKMLMIISFNAIEGKCGRNFFATSLSTTSSISCLEPLRVIHDFLVIKHPQTLIVSRSWLLFGSLSNGFELSLSHGLSKYATLVRMLLCKKCFSEVCVVAGARY